MRKLFKKGKEILVTSESTPLLYAMLDEFEKAGFRIDRTWIKNYNPENGCKNIYTHVIDGIGFYDHRCDTLPIRQYTLPKDWDTVLALINKPDVEEVKTPKIPKYVRAVNAADNQFTVGKVYEVDLTRSSSTSIGVVADDKGESNGWSMVNFKPSTKKAFEEQNKPKSKFKVGDKVFTLHSDYVDMAQLKTISKIEGNRVYTDVTTGWWEEGHTILADEKGMLQLLNYLYPIGTKIMCAKDGERGIINTEIYKNNGNYYVYYADNDRYQYVYLADEERFAENWNGNTAEVNFGSRIFYAFLEEQIISIPDYGNVGIADIKKVIDWYESSPTIKGYKLEANAINFGCHTGTMDDVYTIYETLNKN